MGGDEYEIPADLDDDDGLGAYPVETLPFRGSPWGLVAMAAGTARNIASDISDFFDGVYRWVDQRAAWEEERQEFSDSVKSDFLTLKTLETSEQEG